MPVTFKRVDRHYFFEQGERTRAQIVAAAHHLCIEQGFHAAFMRQIAQEAGLAVGGHLQPFSQ